MPVAKRARIAYIMSCFPKETETFILYEMAQLQRSGISLSVYPLRSRGDGGALHPEVAALLPHTHRTHPFAWRVLRAHGFWLRRKPRAYLAVWWCVLRGNMTSAKFCLRGLAAAWMAAWFAKRLRDDRVQHVHVHWGTHPAVAAFGVRRLTGIPYSVTLHAHDLFVNRSMLGQKLREADFIVTISEYNRRFLAKCYGHAILRKTHVIHCGVNVDAFRPRAPTSPRRVPLFVCVGSLEPYKGHRVLVDACARLQREGYRFRCLCVGRGPLRETLEAQVRTLGVHGRVRFVGALPHDVLQRYLPRCTAAVLPSVVDRHGKMEGIPVALMEALATQLPVVASDLSGISELIVHNESGLLAPPGEPRSLANAMARLIRDPALRQRFGQAGRRHVVDWFNLEVNVAVLKTRLLESAARWGGR